MSWNFLDPASRKNLDDVWRREADGLLELSADPVAWKAPTGAGHWQVRDVVAHVIDTTETYLHCFDAARGKGQLTASLDVRNMARIMDEDALAMRDLDRAELLDRLRVDIDRIMAVVAGLTDGEWAELMVPHKYMGQVPACFFPICHVLDCIVHSWDIREGTGRGHGLDGPSADLLVPVCFLMWQNTCDATGVDPFSLGIRVTTGPNAGGTRANVTDKGIEFVPGDLDDLPAVIEFDPASLVLTAFGRVNAGTYRGDRQVIDRFLNLFFRI